MSGCQSLALKLLQKWHNSTVENNRIRCLMSSITVRDYDDCGGGVNVADVSVKVIKLQHCEIKIGIASMIT